MNPKRTTARITIGPSRIEEILVRNDLAETTK
jgi:hypothetical protein